jgi:predicted nucleotidyltransferase
MPDPRDASPVVLSAFEKAQVDRATFLRVLDRAVHAVERAGVRYLLIGGVAESAYGRPLSTLDVDLFVRPDQAEAALHSLEARGFDSQRTAPHWLFKAYRDGVVIDVIFCSSGDIYIDDDMLARSRHVEIEGVPVRLIAPEDLIVLKALAHSEPTARYWFDALAVLARSTIDWPYLLRRARHGPKRILSFLLFAQSLDLPVPHQVVRDIHRLAAQGETREARARAS